MKVYRGSFLDLQLHLVFGTSKHCYHAFDTVAVFLTLASWGQPVSVGIPTACLLFKEFLFGSSEFMLLICEQEPYSVYQKLRAVLRRHLIDPCDLFMAVPFL